MLSAREYLDLENCILFYEFDEKYDYMLNGKYFYRIPISELYYLRKKYDKQDPGVRLRRRLKKKKLKQWIASFPKFEDIKWPSYWAYYIPWLGDYVTVCTETRDVVEHPRGFAVVHLDNTFDTFYTTDNGATWAVNKGD